ncbi:uncharacterized protein LOC119680444 [Teleopsis dalmanni]|uniref:uncharacterized protein LOC119680444 n=1 Tax=Teleopsis dalmanni TaxID=139649 RepID=UPI0018CF9707|nr:uncharacterized protein LOC119680444 [Teleopsis dalmanni]
MQSTSKYICATILIAAIVAIANANSSRTCYSCSGADCGRTTKSVTVQCFDSLDYCVTIFDKFNVVQKGCSINLPIELRQRCDANTAECHKCNTDRCNNLGQANFMCLECDSEKNADCANNPTAIAATRCSAPTAPNSYCYVKSANNVVSRGCATNIADQESCLKDANCMLCLAGDITNCNSVNIGDMSAAQRTLALNSKFLFNLQGKK